MAELVGAFAASHAPLIARNWDLFTPDQREAIGRPFLLLADRLRAVRPDVLVEIAPDHWSNFFIDNLPSICIGVGAEHGGPPEPFLAPKFGHATLAGDDALGRHIAQRALDSDFEPSISHRLKLDHGFCIPLWRMQLDPIPPIVPIVVNGLEPPMPSVRRCWQWGELLRDAIASYPRDVRVAVLATGGLSHSIGEPTMGDIEPEFDEGCIAAFRSGDAEQLIGFLESALPRAGNGGHEVRNWVIAHAAAGGHGFELIEYRSVPEVYVGCGWAAWNVSAN